MPMRPHTILDQGHLSLNLSIFLWHQIDLEDLIRHNEILLRTFALAKKNKKYEKC